MEGKIKMAIGRYVCRVSYKIVGLTDSTKEDFNKLLSKEDNEHDERGTETEI